MEQEQKTNIVWQLLVNVRRTFWVAWKADRVSVVLTVIMMLFLAAMPLVFGYLYRLFLDELIIAQSTLGVISVSLISLFAFRYIAELANHIRNVYNFQYLDRVFRYRLENFLTLEFTKKLSALDIAHFESSETQSLIQKARSGYAGRIPNFIQNTFFALSSISTLVGAFLVLLPFGWWIPVIMVFATIPGFWLRTKYSKISWSVFNQNIPESKELSYVSSALEDPASIKEIRIFQARDALLQKMEVLQKHIFEELKKPLKKYLSAFYIPLIVEIVALAFLAYYRLPLVIVGVLTIGAYTFFVSMLDQIARSTRELIGELSTLYDQNLYIGYYFDVLALPRLIKEPMHGYRFKEIAPPHIEFRNVSFGYPGGPRVLNNVSFTIRPGEHFAIVGKNGAGKTTLIKLLLRFYDPDDGVILINGKDLRDLKLDNWYKFVGTLFQDFVKFWLTIRENIMLGDAMRTDEERMKEAARKADASDFIEKLPRRYEQRLGKRFEDGVELSQGQWQKMAIARAFYEEAPLLILDEPTSAIDAEAEAAIFDHIDKIYENKNLVLISHRFSSVRSADTIIVLEEGKIIENGTHADLMKKDTTYARMFKTQASGYAN